MRIYFLSMVLNNIYFFISEFGLIFIMGLILLIIYLSPQYHSAKIFTSKNSNTIFDSNYSPKILIHTTDLHITYIKPSRLDGSTIFLASLLEYKVSLSMCQYSQASLGSGIAHNYSLYIIEFVHWR